MRKRLTFLFPGIILLLSLTGCTMSQRSYYVDSETGAVTVDDTLVISGLDERLQLQTKQNNVSANGLYYVPWAIGEGEDFVTAEGKNAILYDAELYFLLGKTRSPEDAKESIESWRGSAGDNYDILSEEPITVNGIDYTILTYHFTDETSPYNGGVSVFGTHDSDALCVEFIHQESYEAEAREILTGFLEKCEFLDS